MEYKKDTRTKNLTLRDIHVGDWVQVWSETTERYSPPLKIISIHDDGTVYLITSDEERCTPWEENIKNVDALPITPELLRGFGFEIEVNKYYDDKICYNGKGLAFLSNLYDVGRDCIGSSINIDTGKYHIGNYTYMHQFIGYVEDYFDVKTEWEGVNK